MFALILQNFPFEFKKNKMEFMFSIQKGQNFFKYLPAQIISLHNTYFHLLVFIFNFLVVGGCIYLFIYNLSGKCVYLLLFIYLYK